MPTPNERTCKLKMTEKIEAFIKNMRWKAMVFVNSDSKTSHNTKKTKFGLKSNKYPPHVKELKAFEDDLIKLVK